LDSRTYRMLEAHMLSCMDDSAHDKDHIYRVLYVALDIAGFEEDVDYDVLICACLLHDIGRREQFEDPRVCHAVVGGEKAYAFLTAHGFSKEYAHRVKECVMTHRFPTDMPPQSIEAKILFDADKIDATGTLGIARTLFYKGQTSQPLYSLTPDGEVSDGAGDTVPSLFQEYKYKLEGLYARFYTRRGAQIARERQAYAQAFYQSMLREVRASYAPGQELLQKHIAD
jgi:uncharacterized protein